ncbi:PPE domain-containing protein [Mycobacteroides abscessus]|uniref:PPE domain-containing protein n=1 Tax=Mycobacteroides abscessus TaxID=36809 RepID=UPI0009C71A4A|nr:PPE domain-containing protein [Mycobacteroides abscessus]SKO13474.1 PPE-repeat proteins [Mycobacteroides abscessus subsp. bolletii]SKX39562.1 PPE-repeat proteins [Mycobacteroides abscessus subsp. bolletii]
MGASSSGADLRWDTEGLAADGAALGASTSVSGPPAAEPPGADTTSVSNTEQLNAHGAALAAHLAHAGLLRAHGGIVTQDVAAQFTQTDAQYAAYLANPQTAAPPQTATGANIPAPQLPEIPVIPAASALPPLTGEAFSRALYGGPGPQSLQQAANYWRSQADQIEQSAHQTRQIGNNVDEHWRNNNPKAATNIRAHATWLDDQADRARSLAGAYEQAGQHYSDHRSQTSSPQEFDNVRNMRNRAAQLNTTGAYTGKILELENKMAVMQSDATTQATSYHSMVNATTGVVTPPPVPAPPIAGSTSAAPNSPVNQGAGQDLKPQQAPNPAGGKPKTNGNTSDPQPGAADLANPLSTLPDTPQAATPLDPATSGIDPQAFGSAANIIGTLTGGGMGALSSLGGSGGGMPGGSPLSALSGLSAPQTPSGGQPSSGGGETPPETPSLGDADGASTSPAGDFGGGGGGGPITASAQNPLPAATPTAPVGGGLSASAAAPTGAAGASMGGAGMMPPMMGGGKGNDTAERDKNLYPDRRVVLRNKPNTEAVFGAVERERKTPKKDDGGK